MSLLEILSTIIVQQFFKHDFPVRHSATTKRSTYRSCLVCDTCIRELIVLDVPLQVRNDWHQFTWTEKRTRSILTSSNQFWNDWLIWCGVFILMRILSKKIWTKCGFCCSIWLFVEKLATISDGQLSWMEWRSTVGPENRSCVCFSLRYGEFGNVSGKTRWQKMNSLYRFSLFFPIWSILWTIYFYGG